MLNKDQKRGLTIALRVVEENMQNIEHILNSKIHKGILYDTNCNIAPEIKEEMLKRGMSDEQIEMAQSMQKNFMNPGFINIMGFVVTSIWGFVLALITSAFIKKEGDPFKTAMQETGE